MLTWPSKIAFLGKCFAAARGAGPIERRFPGIAREDMFV